MGSEDEGNTGERHGEEQGQVGCDEQCQEKRDSTKENEWNEIDAGKNETGRRKTENER